MKYEDQKMFTEKTQLMILQFIERTTNGEDSLAESIKATIAQFISLTLKNVEPIASAHVGMISMVDILEAQIKSLRKCIIDLEFCLNPESLEKTVQ